MYPLEHQKKRKGKQNQKTSKQKCATNKCTDLAKLTLKEKAFLLLNWDSLYTRLNNHYNGWSYNRRRRRQRRKAYQKTYSKETKVTKCFETFAPSSLVFPHHKQNLLLKKDFMGSFYRWGQTASRLEPLK